MVDLILRQSPDIGIRLALAVGTQHLRQTALAEGTGLDVVVKDFREQVGSVHQGFFGGLAHSGTDLFTHGAENEVAGQPDKQEVDQEDADAQAHQLWLGL
ncbi:hypothetical protein D3C76_955960 [compost metagenome]